MENKKAIKLVDKIVADLDNTGINSDALIEDLKSLREYALQEEVPLVVKVLRYTYKHIEEHNSFLVPIPDDEPIEDEEAANESTAGSDPVESLKYLVSLTKSLNNKMNISDLREYRDALNNF